MNIPDIIIAIDGFSSTGKSSFAKALAKRFGFTYLDSGALYRAVTLYGLRKKIDLADESEYDFLNEISVIHLEKSEKLGQGFITHFIKTDNDNYITIRQVLKNYFNMSSRLILKLKKFYKLIYSK